LSRLAVFAVLFFSAFSSSCCPFNPIPPSRRRGDDFFALNGREAPPLRPPFDTAAMQRVSAFLPSWDRRSSGSSSKTGSVFGWPNRSSQPPPPNGLSKINTDAANGIQGKRVQREAFWPATLDLECDKAARILKSFCGMSVCASSSRRIGVLCFTIPYTNCPGSEPKVSTYLHTTIVRTL
jgi:hypothetical protein